MGRPGIMLYFDILEPIKVLPDADKGRLLVAMLEYGRFGTVPEFDGMLALAWGFVRPKLDRDEEAYENSKVQRKYAAFCKKLASKNLPKVPFEEWLDMPDYERERMLTAGNEPIRPVKAVGSRYPSTTAPSATSTSSSVSTTAAADVTESTEDVGGDDGADSVLKVCGGTLGKGVVLLTEEQDADLLDRLGLDVYDYYMDKLSTYIIQNNAHIRNHYETILKWWREDGRIQR